MHPEVADVSKARIMLTFTALVKLGLPMSPCAHLQSRSMEGQQDHSLNQVSQILCSLPVNKAKL